MEINEENETVLLEEHHKSATNRVKRTCTEAVKEALLSLNLF